MQRRLAPLVLLLAIGASLLAACGDDDEGGDGDGAPTTEAEADGGDDGGGDDGGGEAGGDMCDLFQAINDLDDQSESVVNDSIEQVVGATSDEERRAAFDEFAAAFTPFAQEEVPKMLDLYDQLADEVPDERREDVEELRDFTADFLESLGDADSAEDLIAALQAAPEAAQGAGEATLRLDEVSRSECDLVFAD